jgi:hypothetical protein
MPAVHFCTPGRGVTATNQLQIIAHRWDDALARLRLQVEDR